MKGCSKPSEKVGNCIYLKKYFKLFLKYFKHLMFHVPEPSQHSQCSTEQFYKTKDTFWNRFLRKKEVQIGDPMNSV